jgi:hypothetical protein
MRLLAWRHDLVVDNRIRGGTNLAPLPWQPARRNRTSPPHARGRARTMSASSIARHKRAGRIEQRDGELYATQSTETVQHAAV